MTPKDAAAHWRQLATQQREMAIWIESHNRLDIGHPLTYRYRADTYDRTAKALELEAETGQPHCSICFGPHPNHQHGL